MVITERNHQPLDDELLWDEGDCTVSGTLLLTTTSLTLANLQKWMLTLARLWQGHLTKCSVWPYNNWMVVVKELLMCAAVETTFGREGKLSNQNHRESGGNHLHFYRQTCTDLFKRFFVWCITYAVFLGPGPANCDISSKTSPNLVNVRLSNCCVKSVHKACRKDLARYLCFKWHDSDAIAIRLLPVCHPY